MSGGASSARGMCRRPDRDEPKLLCGRPLPCPHHTCVVDESAVTLPHGVPSGVKDKAKLRLVQIKKALR